MPALPVEVTSFLTAVTDKLKYGQNAGTRSTASIGSGANGTVTLTAKASGTAANSWTIAVAVGGGTAPLSVGVVGTAITVTLATNLGAPVTASNTALLIAAALNANVTVAAVFSAAFSGTGASSLSAAASAVSASGGVAQDTNRSNAGINYLRAQDMATVLEIFQNYISNPTVVTATAGSTTTATVASITASSYVGARVTFAANTTTVALRNQVAYVKSNTGTVFTFTTTLPGAVVAGDTFTIQQTLVDAAILQLRGPSRYATNDATLDARSRGDAPAGDVYGLNRTVLDALSRLNEQLGTSLATVAITGSAFKTGSSSTTSSIVTNQTLRIDQFKGYYATIAGVTRLITGNNETTLFVSPAFTSAPAADVAVAIAMATREPAPNNFGAVAPGGQPGDNALLAQAIEKTQATVAAFTIAA